MNETMRTYEKPRLMALSLNGNDQLCGSCAAKGGQQLCKDPTGGMASALDFLVGNDDGTLTRAEAARAFGPDEGCEIPVESYCKFTSSSDMLVAWS